MAKEKLIKINVRNLPNGYALTVGTQEYMYYNPMDLLAGFMVHVGLQETDYMEKGNILTMLFQLLVGEQWEDNVNAMYGKINDMDSRLTFTLNRLEKTAKIGDRLEPRVNEIDETISTLTESITKQKEDHCQQYAHRRPCCRRKQLTPIGKAVDHHSKALSRCGKSPHLTAQSTDHQIVPQLMEQGKGQQIRPSKLDLPATKCVFQNCQNHLAPLRMGHLPEYLQIVFVQAYEFHFRHFDNPLIYCTTTIP
jgi:hypothetical protein